jgi:hypothetical protein
MRGYLVGTLFVLLALSNTVNAQDARCQIHVIGQCAGGQCSAAYQQQLYAQCMRNSPAPVQHPQDECTREVDRVCAQGGCPATVVREIHTRCMLRR